jgi:hypothetical protein
LLNNSWEEEGEEQVQRTAKGIEQEEDGTIPGEKGIKVSV